MAFNVINYVLSRKYVDETLDGAGALQGAPCQVDSVTDTTDGKQVTLKWETNSGTTQTTSFEIKNGEQGLQGEQGIQGVKGEDGFTPSITENTKTSTEYTLKITNEDGDTITPNLKGSGGGTDVSYDSADEELIFS